MDDKDLILQTKKQKTSDNNTEEDVVLENNIDINKNLQDNENNNENNKSVKHKKQKVLLLFGYLGANYQGLQRNPNAYTIEPILENALVKAGAIDECNAGSFKKVAWDRCARTDKGVSARGNVISLRIRMVPDVVSKINEHLPEDIRVFGVHRVSYGFRAKNRCDYRHYEYIIPTYVFEPSSSYKKKIQESNEEVEEPFKFTEVIRNKINEALQKFVGSHNYHNFTSGTKYEDSRAVRVIKHFDCSEPFMMGGIEWVTLKVIGQSFIFNQIRKMVGLVVCIVRDGESSDIINLLFKKYKSREIHLAPGEGLFLVNCLFDHWNKIAKPPNEPITWEKEIEDVNRFYENVLLAHLTKLEKEEQIFKKWLNEVVDPYPMDFQLIRESTK